MKNDWRSNILKEVQRAVDKHDSKTLYSLLRNIFGPLKSLDGKTTVKDPAGILEHWTEHFTNLFFYPCTVDNAAIENLATE